MNGLHTLRSGMRLIIAILAIVISGLFVGLGIEPSSWVLGLTILTVVLFLLGKFDLLHPYTWYCPIFYLYSVSVPILVWMGVKDETESVWQAAFMEWLALVAFALAVGPTVRDVRLRADWITFDLKASAWMLLCASLAISAVYLGYVWKNDLSSKYAIALSESPFVRLDPAFSVYALAFAVLLGSFLRQGNVPWTLVVFSVGWNIFAFLICGERDFVFRVLWIFAFFWDCLYRRVPRWALVVFALCTIGSVPILQDLKSALLSESLPEVDVETPLAVRVISDEFLTGSDNLQVYLESRANGPFFAGETLVWDLRRAVLPGFLFPAEKDPTRWFNETFYPEVLEKGGGKGFTLVGEGYMNFGAFGVVIWFLLLGAFVRYLYVKGTNSLAWFIIYVVSMPLIAFITRADFSNLIAQFAKHIGLPLVILFAGMHVLRWSHTRPESPYDLATSKDSS